MEHRHDVELGQQGRVRQIDVPEVANVVPRQSRLRRHEADVLRMLLG